ncbi:transposase [Streptomyces sp. NPDC059863]|uniref:transposase n=1 Tax=unclassified Streptomyces TaxID=2593676 RepID=UPI003652D579
MHRELRSRTITPVISQKGAPNIKGLGKHRYVVEQTFSLLHQFKRLAVRWERRLELHQAFASLACSLIPPTPHPRPVTCELHVEQTSLAFPRLQDCFTG